MMSWAARAAAAETRAVAARAALDERRKEAASQREAAAEAVKVALAAVEAWRACPHGPGLQAAAYAAVGATPVLSCSSATSSSEATLHVAREYVLAGLVPPKVAFAPKPGGRRVTLEFPMAAAPSLWVSGPWPQPFSTSDLQLYCGTRHMYYWRTASLYDTDSDDNAAVHCVYGDLVRKRLLTRAQFVHLEPHLAVCFKCCTQVIPIKALLVPGCPWQWHVHVDMLRCLGLAGRTDIFRRRGDGWKPPSSAYSDALAVQLAAGVGRGWRPDGAHRPWSVVSLAAAVANSCGQLPVKAAALFMLAGLDPTEIAAQCSVWNAVAALALLVGDVSAALPFVASGFAWPPWRRHLQQLRLSEPRAAWLLPSTV
jgi:hypothetical protein